MLKVGKDIDAVSRWSAVAESYASGMRGGYHAHRLKVIGSLLPHLGGTRVIDFGCGEGAVAVLAASRGAHVVCIDPVAALLDIARKRSTAGEFICGGVEALETNRADCIIAANVISYLTNEEEDRFYRAARRLGASLVITHSNQLFDLFTFNAYTVETCKEWFGCDVSSLVVNPTKPNRYSCNIRENPLSYPSKLARYGYKVERMEFMNLHPIPPLLSNEDPDDMERDRPDTLSTTESDRWKLMFTCSMFGVRATCS